MMPIIVKKYEYVCILTNFARFHNLMHKLKISFLALLLNFHTSFMGHEFFFVSLLNIVKVVKILMLNAKIYIYNVAEKLKPVN